MNEAGGEVHVEVLGKIGPLSPHLLWLFILISSTNTSNSNGPLLH